MEENMGKRLGAILLSVLFGLFVLATGLIFCVKPLCSSAVREAFVGNAIRLRIFDPINEICPGLDLDYAIELDKMVRAHHELDKVSEKYLASIAEAVSSGREIEIPDIRKNLERLNEDILAELKNMTGSDAVEQNRERLMEGLYDAEKDVTDILAELPFFIENFGGEAIGALRIYRIVTSGWIQALMILLTGGLAVLLCRRNRDRMKGVKLMGIAGILDGILLGLLIPALIGRLSLFLTNRILGRAMYLNFSSMRIGGVVFFQVGIALLAIRIFLLKRKEHVLE